MNVQLTEFPPLLPGLIAAGIEVTITPNDKYVQGVHYDLHLEAKSHMHLYKGAGGWRVAMRYGNDFESNTMDDLIYAAKYGMHGRDFINPTWAALIAKEQT